MVTSARDNSLLDFLNEEIPGATVEVSLVGKSLLMGLQGRGAPTVWIALDNPGRCSGHPEDALRLLANRLALCQKCRNTFSASCISCRYEHRVRVRRMRDFLGPAGYERFLARAPIASHEGSLQADEGLPIIESPLAANSASGASNGKSTQTCVP